MEKLVTVAAITYNSGLYIEETLESIYKQSYENLELLISDDCSKDDTIEIVNKWIALEKVKKRFVDIRVITVPQNTGISANCNRAIAGASADWFKSIAGDDILLPDCITDNMAFANANPQVNILFSQVRIYQDDFREEHYVRTTPEIFPDNLMAPHLTAEDQFKLLVVSDRIHYTPSYFCNRQAILKVGGYDEKNRLVEDYPMWLKLTQSGERLNYFHKETVGYRIHSKAMNNTGNAVIFKPSTINNFGIRKAVAHSFLPWEIVRSEHYIYHISKIFQNRGWNKKTGFYPKLYRLALYTNPYHYIYAIKKRLPMYKNNPFYS